MFGIEQDIPYFLADVGIAWIAKAAGFHSILIQPIDQQAGLSAFAATVRAVEYDKLAFKIFFQ